LEQEKLIDEINNKITKRSVRSKWREKKGV
jgi:hypothetical protein